MRRRIALIASAICAVALPAAEPAFNKRPNIIVILADDLGYADVGFNGCTDIPTPNLDSLAKTGVRFTNGYVTHPYCSPSRAGLLTGRYQQRFGHEANPAWLPADTSVGLPVDQITMPQTLRTAGYVTGAIGKWHLGAAPCFHPNERGFADYLGFLGGGHQYMPVNPGSAEYLLPILRNHEPVAFDAYMTDLLSREAAAFITRHKAEPFFLYIAYNAVHTPLQAPEKYLSRFAGITDQRRRTYAAMTSAMDDGIGQVLAAVRDQGLDQDTQVWFMSDNGGPPPHVAPTSNTPLKGHKGTMYEGGIRVPFVMRWPARAPAGRVVDIPVSSLDIFPTALAASGAKAPTGVRLDGVDLTGLLDGSASSLPRTVLHWRDGGSKGNRWAVREGRYKLVRMGQEAAQLFDLDTDIAESKDIAASQPAVVARLQQAHDAWNSELIEPRWSSPKAAKKPKPQEQP